MEFPRISEDNRSETISLKFGPFLNLFVQNRQNPAADLSGCSAPLFIRPFLTYAAEYSASWQHWKICKIKRRMWSVSEFSCLYDHLGALVTREHGGVYGASLHARTVLKEKTKNFRIIEEKRNLAI